MSDTDLIQLGEETFPLAESVSSLAQFFGHYDTDLMVTQTSGVIVHRGGLGSEQIVYQMQPQFRAVTYRQHESSGPEDSKTYWLPFPYIIVIISYENNVFRGIRHFYSPEPIMSLDQQLYMVSLPNTNCSGYNNTSIGWVCIYHHVHPDFTSASLHDKLQYALERYNPVTEPYNYENMSEVDGYAFYCDHDMDEYTYNPNIWQTKGEKDGLGWVIKSDTWIPASASSDKAESYDPDASPYTLRKALYDEHYVYYDEQGAIDLNKCVALSKKDKAAFIKKYLRKSLLGSAVLDDPIEPTKETLVSIFKKLNHSRMRAEVHLPATMHTNQYLKHASPTVIIYALPTAQVYSGDETDSDPEYDSEYNEEYTSDDEHEDEDYDGGPDYAEDAPNNF